MFSANAKTVFVSDGTVGGANTYTESTGILTKGCSWTDGTGRYGHSACQSDPDRFHADGTGSVATYACAGQYDRHHRRPPSWFRSVRGRYGGLATPSRLGTLLSDAVNQLNAQFNQANNGVVASIGATNKLVLTGTQPIPRPPVPTPWF